MTNFLLIVQVLPQLNLDLEASTKMGITLKPLAHSLDKAFEEIYLNLPAIKSLSNFFKESKQFIETNYSDFALMDAFFQNFTPIWENNLLPFETLWEIALEPAFIFEKNNLGKRVHKGTPFYFWGLADIQNGNLDRGFVLMHRALMEDKNTFPLPLFENKPPYLVVTLDDSNQNNFFYKWVQERINFLDKLIKEYNSSYNNSKLDIPTFRSKLLQNDADIAFLFTYTLARLDNLESILKYKAGSFQGQINLNLLSDMALIIECAIKKSPGNPNKNETFIHQAAYYSQKRSLNLSRKYLNKINAELNTEFDQTLDFLREINAKFNTKFDQTLIATLGGKLTLNNGYQITQREEIDLAVTYGIRNYGAHNISSTSVLLEKFPEIRQSLFNILFATVEYLL